MDLLKCLFPICFLPLAVFFSHETSTAVTFKETDTIKVYSTGINNKIVIDSIHLKGSLNEVFLSTVKGEVTQNGQNNSVDIKTGDKTLNNKNKVASNKNTSTINIKQTGKNNSVKINSR